MLIIMLIIELQLKYEENYENCAQTRAGVILYRLSRLLRQLKPLQFTFYLLWPPEATARDSYFSVEH